MVTFTCPYCGKERTGVRRRCYECTGFKGTPESAEKNRQASLGRIHSVESRQKNSEWHKLHIEHCYPVGEFTRGKHPHNWIPTGSERRSNGHTKVKCEDGKWRYKARLVWVKANGFIPEGMLIHHRNEDPYDDRLENFEMVTRAEHAKLHADSETMKEGR